MWWSTCSAFLAVTAGVERIGSAVVARLGANDKKWVLGDLALQRIPIQDHSEGDYRHTGVDEQLEELANALGVKFKSLRAYRGIAKAWPEEHRRYDLAWTVHAVLRVFPNRFELIHDHEWTSTEAREYRSDHSPKAPK